MTHIASVAFALTVACLVGTPAFAQSLTVVDATQAPAKEFELTLEEAEALEQGEITTGTAWTEGEQVFSGPTTAAIAEMIEGDYSEVAAVALNDYEVILPEEDFEEGAAIIATRIDGDPISIRERGPFWVMFDFDAMSTAERTSAERRSAWQLKRLTFR